MGPISGRIEECELDQFGRLLLRLNDIEWDVKRAFHGGREISLATAKAFCDAGPVNCWLFGLRQDDLGLHIGDAERVEIWAA